MNKAKEEFLKRNDDPSIKSYLFYRNQPGIIEFVVYPYSQMDKRGIVDGYIATGYTEKDWSEDKIFLSSFEDVEFFVDWYNIENATKAKIVKG